MRFFKLIERFLKAILPSPFTIAILLTIVTFILALTIAPVGGDFGNRIIQVAKYWEEGIWNPPLMVFAMQMMLMLVLGHVLALTEPVDRLIRSVLVYCKNTATSAFVVTLLTILVALFNWGLGLIFGAILARKVGEYAHKQKMTLNYPLIGAAGYSGLMVWHGGISGSAPIKAAEEGHLKGLMSGVLDENVLEGLPGSLSFSETVFGSMNLTTILLLVIVLPLFMYLLGKKFDTAAHLPGKHFTLSNPTEGKAAGAERIDHVRWLPIVIGGLMLVYTVYSATDSYATNGLGFITPNFINLLLLGMGLFFHRSISSFLQAVNEAIGGASGILIQFPLYFGIMGIMSSSGLVELMSDFFVSISTERTFPIFSFFSAGIVNVFVPSGGGQWGVQGPIIIKAALELGVSMPKALMALAYGDQLTNMLQPFWALPLLGITGLSARSILPYTVSLMFIGIALFCGVLLIF